MLIIEANPDMQQSDESENFVVADNCLLKITALFEILSRLDLRYESATREQIQESLTHLHNALQEYCDLGITLASEARRHLEMLNESVTELSRGIGEAQERKEVQ